MKNILLIIFLLQLTMTGIKAQSIGGGLIGGINASQVDGDTHAGYHKLGLNVGAVGIIPINPKMAISMEILYNQKGSHRRPHPNDPNASSYKLRLNYLDVPILLNFKDKNKLIVAAGLSYGTLVNYQEIINGFINPYPVGSEPWRTYDINALIDFKYPITEKLYFNFRYAYSAIGIRSYIDYMGRLRGQRNHYLGFRTLYLINY
jgi:hypothetical protein